MEADREDDTTRRTSSRQENAARDLAEIQEIREGLAREKAEGLAKSRPGTPAGNNSSTEEEIDQTSPLPEASPGPGDTWQHPDLPDLKINDLSPQECYQWLDKFDKTYHLRVPGKTDLMVLPQLRQTVRDLSRSPVLHTAFEEEAREKRENQYRGDFAIIDNRGIVRLNYQGIADHLIHKFNTVTFNDTVFVYDQERGIYRENRGELEGEIGEITRIIGYEGSTTKGTREVLYYVMYSAPPIREYPFNRCEDFIPVQNGIVKINYETGTRDLIPHSPDHKVTFTLPVRYDDQADAGPIKEILSQWVREEDTPILTQIPAQALIQMQTDRTFKRSYILQGEYNAGKSTYLKLLQSFLGGENITHVSLQGIAEDRFSTGKLENRILNIFDDLADAALQNTGIFKNLTGSTHHDIERKHVQGYDGRIYCVHVFSCNRPPQVPEEALYDPAFWERWCYISFPYFFPLDPAFEEVLLTEGNMSALFNIVVDRMIEIRQARTLTINHTANEVRDRWVEEADPLAQFLKDKFEKLAPPEKTEFDRDGLFTALSQWYDEKQINPKQRIGSLAQLTRDLMRYEIMNRKTSTTRDKRKFDYYAYRGPYQWKDPETRDSMIPKIPSLEKYLEEKK